VVPVVQWATLQIDNTSKPIKIVDGSCSGNLGSEAVAANRGERNLLLVHESNNIVAKVVHVVGWVVVRAALVSVIKKPHISHGRNLVFRVIEEFREVFRWFDKLWQPDHRWQIFTLALQEGALELNVFGSLNASCNNSSLDTYVGFYLPPKKRAFT